MPFYQWNQELLTVNTPAMDNEHQVLIQKMNAVYDSYKEGKTRSEIEAVVTEFVNYTIVHFKDEELYMEKIAYQGIASHKIIHKQLLSEVEKHVEDFKKTGTLSDNFFGFLSVWLTSHIRGIDSKYGQKN